MIQNYIRKLNVISSFLIPPGCLDGSCAKLIGRLRSIHHSGPSRVGIMAHKKVISLRPGHLHVTTCPAYPVGIRRGMLTTTLTRTDGPARGQIALPNPNSPPLFLWFLRLRLRIAIASILTWKKMFPRPVAPYYYYYRLMALPCPSRPPPGCRIVPFIAAIM